MQIEKTFIKSEQETKAFEGDTYIFEEVKSLRDKYNIKK